MMTRQSGPAGLILTLLVAATVVAAGCGKKEPAAPAPTPAAEAPTAPAAPAAAEPAAPAAVATPAPSADQVEASLALTPENLETLLAPIALFPDPVLAQVLVASTNPQMVLDAGNWLLQNQNLTGKALDEAAQPLGFSPSMRALLQFPEVVDMMCMQIDWTTDLGAAFTADQAGVLDAVQRLRRQSVDVGNLKTSDQMKVETTTEDGKEVITVEPANPKVVYVPQYDPVAVYAPPPAVIPPPTTTVVPATTTVVQQPTGYSTGAMVTTGLLSFGAGLLVANVFDDDDDDYYNYRPNYGYGGMYYGNRPYYPPPPSYYRPNYGGSFRPGSDYNRPPNYQHGFNNNTIIVNNQGTDYWKNTSRAPGASTLPARSPISQARSDRPELTSLNDKERARANEPRKVPTAADRSTGWQGQSKYEGAKQGKPKVQGGYAGAKPENKAARDQMLQDRPAMPSAAPAAAKNVDRGYGGSARPDTRDTQSRPTPAKADRQPSRPSAPAKVDRQPSRPSTADRAAAPKPASRPSSERTSGSSSREGRSAVSGSGASRGNEQAASQRGRQSMPQGAKSKGSGKSAAKSGGGKGRR